MKKNLVLFSVISLLLVGCAVHYGEGDLLDPSGSVASVKPYGFFFGVWHGLIFFFSLLGIFISWIAYGIFDALILADVRLIGKPNTGLSYGIGYFIGFIIMLIVGNDPSSTTSIADQCQGRTKKGKRCSKRAKGNGYCGFHGGY